MTSLLCHIITSLLLFHNFEHPMYRVAWEYWKGLGLGYSSFTFNGLVVQALDIEESNSLRKETEKDGGKILELSVHLGSKTH